MRHNSPGLRFAGDHVQTLCCGVEALPPDSDDLIPDHVDAGRVEDNGEHQWPHEDEYDDAVHTVCPKCGRTWRDDDCEHDEITVTHPSNPTITEHSRWFTAVCEDCDRTVDVHVGVDEIRVQDE